MFLFLKPMGEYMKFDLHIHSDKSYDCLSSISKIVAAAKNRGISGIAITDHGLVYDGSVQELEELHGVWVIPGVEVYTEIGDIIGLYIAKQIVGNAADKVIDEIHHQGGLVILPHPYKRMKEYPINILQKIDAVEVINSRWVDLRDFSDIKKIQDILSIIPGRTAGSDAHLVCEIGNAYMETHLLSSKDQLRDMILAGSGNLCYKQMTSWLDLASQGVKCLKKPSMMQFVRLCVYLSRQIFTCQKKI
jgi:predicted metal-dependent phosphoesterase TrpH